MQRFVKGDRNSLLRFRRPAGTDMQAAWSWSETTKARKIVPTTSTGLILPVESVR